MTWYLQSHAVWLKLWYSSIGFLLFVCLAAHVLEFLRWTPGSVKLLLPPRHSRGASYVRLAAQYGHLPVVKLLVERGADLSIKDDLYQATPESAANHFGQTEVRNYLKSAR